MYYRLTEVAAADGYQLLTECVYEGGIPLDTLNVSMWVVNAPIFTLPQTGGSGQANVLICVTVCAMIGVFALMIHRKKRNYDHSQC